MWLVVCVCVATQPLRADKQLSIPPSQPLYPSSIVLPLAGTRLLAPEPENKQVEVQDWTHKLLLLLLLSLPNANLMLCLRVCVCALVCD